MSSDLIIEKEYKAWLSDIKLKVRNVQIKAALKVQAELLTFYWELGADIVAKQTHARWGDGLIEQLSRDLMVEFPEIKGFSRRNLMYIKKWYLFYRSATFPSPIVQQPVAQLTAGQKGQQPVGQIQEAEKSQQVVGQIEQREDFPYRCRICPERHQQAYWCFRIPVDRKHPRYFKGSLPTVEQIKAELGGERR